MNDIKGQVDAAMRDFNITMHRLRDTDPSAALVLYTYRERALAAEDRLHRVREALEEADNG